MSLRLPLGTAAIALSCVVGAWGCAGERGRNTQLPPTLEPVRPSPSSLPSPEIGLPFHAAAIVDLALVPPGPGERWRLISGDREGYVRHFADRRLLALTHAHPEGLSALVVGSEGTVYTAGVGGRVLEWPAHATRPERAWNLDRPITALALTPRGQLALSDGHHVQLWSIAGEPKLEWSDEPRRGFGTGFVTGLSVSADGSILAAAELRARALRKALAWHPLAAEALLAHLDPGERERLRRLAEYDFPDAHADLIEVWKLDSGRSRTVDPEGPIEAELAVLDSGEIIHRTIYDRAQSVVLAHGFGDLAVLPSTWAYWPAAETFPSRESFSSPDLLVGDFELSPGGTFVVVDHFAGWQFEPPAQGWRVGPQRELALDHRHVAVGDALGNLLVTAIAGDTREVWRASARELPQLVAAAPNSAVIATATLEPRARYRLWDLERGTHTLVRVEAPWQVVPGVAGPGADPAAGVSMYPSALALDAEATRLIVTMTSVDPPGHALVRAIRSADGRATILTLTRSLAGLHVALDPGGAWISAWAPGSAGTSLLPPSTSAGWTPGPEQAAGVPLVSSEGSWRAFVGPSRWRIEDREGARRVELARDRTGDDAADSTPLAALSDEGSLAVVAPFGADLVELVHGDGRPGERVELPGAATALAWVREREGPGETTLIVGFEDGSIVRVNRTEGRAELRPIHAGQGGRVWTLAPLGEQAVFVELDAAGLTLHRLDDHATLELWVADDAALASSALSSPVAASSRDLVAIWRPGEAAPACAVFDGTRAGVLLPEGVRRVVPEVTGEGGEFFARFLAGLSCDPPPAPLPITPVAWDP